MGAAETIPDLVVSLIQRAMLQAAVNGSQMKGNSNGAD